MIQQQLKEENFHDPLTELASWDFRGADTKQYSHCYHNYPAMMIPQIARRLIGAFGPSKSGLLFDPFCGTGTTLVEGLLSGHTVIGTDLNPLAAFIAKTKCSQPDILSIREEINNVYDLTERIGLNARSIPEFKNLEFWFTKNTIVELAALKEAIMTVKNEIDRNFLLVSFSETVRECSLTKQGEFKLVRRKDIGTNYLPVHVLTTFRSKVERNMNGLIEFQKALGFRYKSLDYKIKSFDTSKGIPKDQIERNSVDLVVTSPPYGDSSTTVAYGQYSRLSSQWLGFESPFQVDNKLMGGTKSKHLYSFGHLHLDATISMISNLNMERAKVVSAFYEELEQSCNNVAKVIKPFGYACYVVSNRRVQGMELPTDSIISEFFARNSFREIAKYTRAIPNKRMPLRNSPSNKVGAVENTMSQESILVMQKTTLS